MSLPIASKTVQIMNELRLNLRRELTFSSDGVDHIGYYEISHIERQGDDFSCFWSIQLETKRTGHVFGADELQALILCTKIINAHLENAEKRGLSVQWNDGSARL